MGGGPAPRMIFKIARRAGFSGARRPKRTQENRGVATCSNPTPKVWNNKNTAEDLASHSEAKDPSRTPPPKDRALDEQTQHRVSCLAMPKQEREDHGKGS